MRRFHPLRAWTLGALSPPGWGRRAPRRLGAARFLVGVQGVVFDEAERVLVLQHTYRRRQPWDIPAGFVGDRESLEAALARELEEETGLVIRVGEVFHVYDTGDRPGQMIDLCFLCSYQGGTFRPNAEIAAMRFCALDDLPPDMPDRRSLLTRALVLHRQRADERDRGTPAR